MHTPLQRNAAPPPGAPSHHDDAWASARWRVQLLGGLVLSDGQRQITRLPSRAHVALLARLAMAPQRAHAREELVELLWPGVALQTGRNRLRQVLSTLKSVLEAPGADGTGAVVLADRTSLRVAPNALACDVPRFEHCARLGRAAEAAALYRGELLPGYYDEWIDDERTRLAALRDALPAATLAAVAEPEPSAPAAAPRPIDMARASLPHYLTPLFGGSAAAAGLLALLREHRLVTVLGPGGSGKTRLAVEVARSLGAPPDAEAHAPAHDLVLFVPLVACQRRAQLVDALAAAMQRAPAPGDPLGAVADALAGRRALLVLDNFEQLVPQAQDVVAGLLARLPLLQVLATSRRPLGLDGEREFAMPALPLPKASQALGEVAANPAVALFIDRARAVRADFHLSERNREALVALVHELEGMPLAIELAASRLRSFAPAELLQRLRGGGTPRLQLLARGGPRGGADPRHASIERVVAWSWQQLNAPAARLLGALTVFRGPFGAAAACEVGHVGDDDPALALDELLTHCLLRPAGSVDDSPRFALYEPVREYALAHTGAAEAAQARQALRRWALLWAREQPPTPSLPALRAEMPNLVAALDSAVHDQAPADAVHLLAALRRPLEDVGLPLEALALAHDAVAACADATLRARGQVLLAPLLFTAGQADAGLAHAEAGVAGSPGPRERASALHGLARVRWRSRRRPDEVEPLLDEAEALEAAHPDADLRASLLALRAFVSNIGHRAHARGEALHAQALALWQRQGNQHAINSGRYNLAVCAQNAGRHALTLQLLAPVLASARELHDLRRISQALNVQGNAHSGLRQWPQAIECYRECLRQAWQTMAPFDLAFGFWNLPRALAHLRQPVLAVQLMAFAAAFWEQRFGELAPADRRYIERIRRLVARQVSSSEYQCAWQAGAALDLPQAYALALAD